MTPSNPTRARAAAAARPLPWLIAAVLSQFLLALGAAAQAAGGGAGAAEGGTALRVLEARAAHDAPPVIDGALDDAAWRDAPVAEGFVQMRPSPGQPATERTEARLLYTDDAIYVGMRLYDSPDSVTAQLARRDASGVFTDWAHVLIDSYDDNRTAFRFSVTPKGSKKDVLHYDDFSEDLNWDAVWEAATSVDSLGWVAEFRIPLSQLRFSSGAAGGEELVWGVNFSREIARRGEWAWWAPVLPQAGGVVSQAGELRGLSGIDAPRRLELLPYTVGRITRAPAEPENPFYEATAAAAAVGLDLRLGLTSNVTLSGTINPDFGQVEADPSVVNLSAFETFFPEKRPFFIEGSNIFNFNVGYDDNSGESLFYSRRIGRAPQRFIGDARWVDAPDATTILGAAKLSGKTSSGWTLGLLNATTAEEDARVARAGAEIGSEVVEPLSNYTVGSLSRDFSEGRSTLGALVTATWRDLDGRPELAFLRSSAFSGGITGRHRFAENTWEASAYLSGSHIRGEADAIARVQRSAGHYFQRPDAEHLDYDPTRTSLTGALANFGLWKIGGGSIRGGIGGHARTPGLELNDLGFQMAADQILLFGNLRYHQFAPRGPFRSFHIGLNPSWGSTTGGEFTWFQLGTFANYELHNFWNGGFWVGLRPLATLTTGSARGGPAVRRDPHVQSSVWLNTDRRRPVVASMNVGGGGETQSGAWNVFVSPGLTFRPSAQLNLSLQPMLSRNANTWQYVAQPREADGTPHYVFAKIDQTTVALTTRLNYTVSPTLSFELYAQPFISGASYSEFKEVVAPRSPDWDERFRTFPEAALRYDTDAAAYRADVDGDGAPDFAFGDPDFNFRQMRGNAVLRWEYLPGSTVYLVWSQSRTGFLPGGGEDVFALGRDARRLFNRDDAFPTPVTNVFLVKLSYWLDP